MSPGALPGFRDFYPEQLAERAHIIRAWREVARRYAFVEYDGPPLEPLELYTRKSGEEIVGQLYNFVDKGGREVALRPVALDIIGAFGLTPDDIVGRVAEGGILTAYLTSLGIPPGAMDGVYGV